MLKTDNEAFAIYIQEKLNGIIPDRYREVQGRIVIEDKKSSDSFGVNLTMSKIIKIILLITILL